MPKPRTQHTEPIPAQPDKFAWFDAQAYLQRIGIDKAENPDLRFLKRLHRQHLYHIPFENLDIHWGREILLDLPKLYKKVINDARGGFCYELNGLFATLLVRLGYSAHMVSAQMLQADNTITPDFEHMAILVVLGEHTWLADVGFGKGFTSPVKLLPGHVQMDFNRFYKTVESEEIWWLQESADGVNFTSRYGFSLKRKNLVEFIGRCQYQQHDPTSHFRKQRLITLATPEGRITLSDRQLIVLSRGERKEYDLLNEDDFDIKLEEYFKIKRPTD